MDHGGLGDPDPSSLRGDISWQRPTRLRRVLHPALAARIPERGCGGAQVPAHGR